MRPVSTFPKVIVVQLFTLPLSHVAIFAQGALTPSGAPAPLFKTLQQVEPRTPISSLPVAVSTSGSYYLTGNLTGGPGGITIAANGVTLDLMGFELVGGTGDGVIVGTSTNVCVRNGRITGWSRAVSSHFTTAVVVEDLTVSGNTSGGINVGKGSQVRRCEVRSNGGSGIFVYEQTTVTDCTVALNSGGIFGNGENLIAHCNVFSNGAGSGAISVGPGSTVLDCVSTFGQDGIAAGTGCLVSRCTTSNNSFDGINVGAGSRVSDCVAWKNGAVGIVAAAGSTVSSCSATENTANGLSVGTIGKVSDCVARSNGGVGISAGNGSTISGSTAAENTNHGLTVGTSGHVSGCTSTSNGGSGISADQGSTIAGCTARSNTVDGVVATFAATVRDCTASENLNDGIQVTSGSLVVDNNCYNNGPSANDGAGVHATGNNNRIEGNNIAFGDRGIDVDGIDNLIIRNSVSVSTTNYSIAANNKVGGIVAAPNSVAISGSTGGAGVSSTDPWANISY